MTEHVLEPTTVLDIRKKFARSLIWFLGISLYGISIYIDLLSLEEGTVDSVNILAPIKYCYENFGFYGAILPFLVMGAFFIFKMINAYLYQRKIIKEYGQKAFDDAILELSRKLPRVLRSTDEKGQYPKSTKLLAVLMGGIFLLVFLGMLLGYIK